MYIHTVSFDIKIPESSDFCSGLIFYSSTIKTSEHWLAS
jgi:hypothetical protein